MCHFYCYKLWQKKVLKAINLRAQYMDNRTRRLRSTGKTALSIFHYTAGRAWSDHQTEAHCL